MSLGVFPRKTIVSLTVTANTGKSLKAEFAAVIGSGLLSQFLGQDRALWGGIPIWPGGWRRLLLGLLP